MRKGLSAFKLVPQRSKHHSVHKKPLSQDAQKPLSQHAQEKEVMMLTRWAMSSKSKTGTPKRESCAPNLYRQLQFSSVSYNYQRWAPILNPVLRQTYSQIHKSLQIELNYPKRVATMSKYTCHLLLYIIIYYMFFYFYYILFYIICILFLLYVILYYINGHNTIMIFLLKNLKSCKP